MPGSPLTGLELHFHIRHLYGDPRSQRLRKRRARRLRPIRPSRRAELWYQAQLRSLVRHLRAAGDRIIAGLAPRWPQVHDAEPPPGLDFLLTTAGLAFRNIGGFAQTIAANAVSQNRTDVDERLATSVNQSLNIDIRAQLTDGSSLALEMARAARTNVELIQSIPEQYFDRIRADVTEAFATGQPWASVTARIQEIGDITENRAKLIARDQTSKMNAAFNGVRQRELGIEKYEWQTAGDERVRDSHDAVDGQVFRWDSPPSVDGETVHPGEAINCRCVAAPQFDVEELPAQSPLNEPDVQAEAA